MSDGFSLMEGSAYESRSNQTQVVSTHYLSTSDIIDLDLAWSTLACNMYGVIMVPNSHFVLDKKPSQWDIGQFGQIFRFLE